MKSKIIFFLSVVAVASSSQFSAAIANTASESVSPALENVPVTSDFLKNELVMTESGGGLSGSYNRETSTTGLNLSGEYHRALSPLFQLGVLAGYSRTETRYEGVGRDSINAGFEVGGLATVNFGDRLPASYFLRASLTSFVSVQSNRNEDFRTATGQMRFGKRFELVPQVSFAPYLYVETTGNIVPRTSYSYAYGLRLISASVHW